MLMNVISIQQDERLLWVGQSVLRHDSHEKVIGKAQYTFDLLPSHALEGKIKRSSVAHARIKEIDTNAALRLPGVRSVVTGSDLPNGLRGMGLEDTPILARGTVRYVGEPIAAVAADTEEVALEALELIKVNYTELSPVFDPEEAASSNPPEVIHPQLSSYNRTLPPLPSSHSKLPNVCSVMKINFGDVTRGFSESHLVLENHFSTAMVHATHLEPCVAIAQRSPDDCLTVWSSAQSAYRIRKELSDALEMPMHRIRVKVPHVGGGFGNKLTVSAEAIAAVLAWRTRHPVRVAFSREETFIGSTVRHPFKIDIRDGVMENGVIRARELHVLLDGGAYSGGGGIQVGRTACFAALATYSLPAFKFESCRVYTNKSPAGSFRGFGTAQMDWAIESQMDMIAEQMNLSPMEFRSRNLMKEGEVNAIGEKLIAIDNRRCLKKVEEFMTSSQLPRETTPWKVGRGIALTDKYGAGPSASVAFVRVKEDRHVEIWTSAMEIGVGSHTILPQIVAEVLKIPCQDVKSVQVDTAQTPFDSGAYSSRQTYHTGNAVRLAALDVRKQILESASKKMAQRPHELEFSDWEIRSIVDRNLQMPFQDLFVRNIAKGGDFLEEGGEFFGKGTYYQKIGSLDPETGKCATDRATAFYTPTALCAEVSVNIETGKILVRRIFTAMDVGKAINPKLVECMIEGSVFMGTSTALFEEMVLDEGRVVDPDFKDYKVISSLDMPRMESVILETPHPDGPFGARGAGEAAITAVAPAIGNAVYDAVKVRIKDLPITGEKILRQLKSQQNNYST
jgi:CO/xanthine dehydrogenase Mo-binding subunit